MEPAVQRRAKRLPPPERRDQVLDAARGLILRFGYAGLTMNAAARAARVTRPVVYDFFANREELLQALLDREQQRVLAAAVQTAPDLSRPGRGVDELVVESMVAFLRLVQEEPETWRLILLPPQGAPEPARERVEAGRRLVLAQLQSVAARVLERRDGPEPDLELVAEFVLQFCERSIRLMLTDPDRYPPERIVELVRRLTPALTGGRR